VGIKDKSDMSEDYDKNDEILPFRVNTDPNILLNNEDAPWLWHNHNQGTYCNTLGVKHALSISNHTHEHHLAIIVTCDNKGNMESKHAKHDFKT
jgi:hypothetical protein